jgi:hypothetical protein
MEKQLSVIGIDLAKSVFHVVGMDHCGTVMLRKRLSREAVMGFIAQLPPLLIGLEACGSAHYWARRFRDPGHEVKLISPHSVRPYVKSNKNRAGLPHPPRGRAVLVAPEPPPPLSGGERSHVPRNLVYEPVVAVDDNSRGRGFDRATHW